MRVPPLGHWLIAAALATAPLFATTTALAEAPQVKTQAPGFYRMMVGRFEVTALYDGYVDLDPKLLKNASQRDIQRLLARRFATGPTMQTAVNAYLINTGSKLVLIDTGAAKAFGPALGFVPDHLRAAGYDPAKVDMVLLTHLHGDHVNGLLNADGKTAFPNASVHVAKADADFWLPAEALAQADEASRPFFQMAQAALAPYQSAGRFSTFTDGAELIPGFRVSAAPGHTPGHSAFMIESAGQQLLVWGDIIHNAAVQFEKPEVAIEFDIDRKLAVATRQKLLNRAVKDKLLVAGMHLPFPGIGHVRREGKGSYEWIPIEYGPIR